MTGPTDTIVSTATPAGIGGVGIVRVSGPAVPAIATALLGSVPEPRQATLRTFVAADGAPIDRGIALFFPGPNSFTGEDVLELHGHGGPVVLQLLVQAARDQGARQAEAGEFSKRAFLNDRLDLVQAEAIADLIASGSTRAAQAALRSLSGEFSSAVLALTQTVTELRVHVEAAIDFPEEEIDFLSDAALLNRLDRCDQAFDELQQRIQQGRRLRDGIRVVLAGQPNAGKSSLLNRLSGADSAIVTDIAGTTRDVLREFVDVDGLSVEFVDTAGLRDNPDTIEAEGIRRANDAMASADIVLWVCDATVAVHTPPEVPDSVAVLRVYNKTDIAAVADSGAGTVAVSAKTGAGLDTLRQQIATLAGDQGSADGEFTARQRHVDALQTARLHFEAGQHALREMGAGEILAEELRLAQGALGQITGEVSADALLGEIFSSFCIGK